MMAQKPVIQPRVCGYSRVNQYSFMEAGQRFGAEGMPVLIASNTPLTLNEPCRIADDDTVFVPVREATVEEFQSVYVTVFGDCPLNPDYHRYFYEVRAD